MKTDKRNWCICLKNPLWKGWNPLVRMYRVSREEAEAEAKKAMIYYEGSTAWKIISFR